MKQNELIELIEKCRAGDRQAQEDLLTLTQDRVYYSCKRILKSEEDARDATQDILIAVITGLDTLREAASFWGWVNRITANQCSKKIEQDRRELRFLKAEEQAAVLAAYGDLDDQMIPDKALDNAETRQMILELVDALPEAQRMCVLMYYYNEMSVKDIAAATGTSEGTVKSRLSYARKSIKEGAKRYIAQGLKLYGLSPLPFIQYFLQQEAERGVLDALALESIRQAVLAAGVTAGAAGSSAVLAVETAGGILAHKGLMALAGLALAGAVVGTTLLQKPEAEDVPAPKPVVEAVLPSSRPEQAPPSAVPVVQQPEKVETVPAVFRPEDPAAVPARQPEPEPEPEHEPDPEPKPDRDDDRDDDTDDEPDTPVAPEPDPELDSLLQPNPECGTYLGVNEDGVHEFELEIQADRESQPLPFLSAHIYTTHEISDSAVVGSRAQYFYGTAPGTAEVRYYASRTKEGPYELKAIVYVTVVPVEEPSLYQVNPACGTYLGETESGVYEFRMEIPADQESQPAPLLPGAFYVNVESSNPDVAGCRSQYFYGAAPGTAEVRYYVSETPEGPYALKAVVYVTVVPVEEPSLYEVNPACGTYLGETDSGVYEFQMEIPADQENQPMPLLPGEFYVEVESSDSDVAGCRSQYFYGAAPGTAEVRYYVSETPEGPYELKAVVYVTVVPEEPGIEPGTTVNKDLSLNYGYNSTFAGEWQEPLSAQMSYTSSDPAVVYINETGAFSTLSPGTAVLTAVDPLEPDCRYTLTVQVQDAFDWDYQIDDVTLYKGDYRYHFISPYSLDGSKSLLSGSWTSSDPTVVQIGMQYPTDCQIFGMARGSATVTGVITFRVQTRAGEKEMQDTVSFQVTVKDTDLYEVNPACGTYLGETDSGVYEFQIEIPADQENQPVPLLPGAFYVRAESSNPDVAGCRSQYFYGLRAGTAEVCYYVSEEPEGPYELKAVVYVTVVPEESESGTTVNKDLSLNYGYNSTFAGEWQETLSAQLSYTSSDPAVVYINETGAFSTLSPGTAVLAAVDPSEPDCRYTLTVQVQDAFDWEYQIDDVTLYKGDRTYHFISPYSMDRSKSFLSGSWTSSDPTVVQIGTQYPTDCQLFGMAQGSATVTCVITFRVETRAGEKEMQDTISFQVTVIE